MSPATFAFPTTITDASGNSSTVQYRFDIGANVWAQSPTPYGASTGKTTLRTYDDTTGRLVKDKIESTGAYTRYDYPNNDGVTVRTYSTIVDIGAEVKRRHISQFSLKRDSPEIRVRTRAGERKAKIFLTVIPGGVQTFMEVRIDTALRPAI